MPRGRPRKVRDGVLIQVVVERPVHEILLRLSSSIREECPGETLADTVRRVIDYVVYEEGTDDATEKPDSQAGRAAP